MSKVNLDTGAGIAAEHLDALFEPFNRLGLDDGSIEGTGIGLTITHRLVRMMGGAVGVSSEVLKADEIFGSVESVKAASDLHAPLSGTVTAVNDDLEETPEKINTDPYGIAWLIKIKLSNRAELDGLMTPEAYQTYCAGRD